MIIDDDEEGPEALAVPGFSGRSSFTLAIAPDRASPVTVGRSPTNDLVLTGGDVSRQHARLERRLDGWWVCDLGSTNGTWIDNEQVERARVRRGTWLRFGSTRVLFGSDWFCERLVPPEGPRTMDRVTQAPLRQMLPELLEYELEKAQSTGAPLAFLFLAFYRLEWLFKFFGYRAGDAVLREVTARIRAHLRAGDVLVRYGHAELLLVLPRTPLEHAATLAERIRSALAASPMVYRDEAFAMVASFGWALADPRDPDPLAAVDRARQQTGEGGS